MASDDPATEMGLSDDVVKKLTPPGNLAHKYKTSYTWDKRFKIIAVALFFIAYVLAVTAAMWEYNVLIWVATIVIIASGISFTLSIIVQYHMGNLDINKEEATRYALLESIRAHHDEKYNEMMEELEYVSKLINDDDNHAFQLETREQLKRYIEIVSNSYDSEALASKSHYLVMNNFLDPLELATDQSAVEMIDTVETHPDAQKTEYTVKSIFVEFLGDLRSNRYVRTAGIGVIVILIAVSARIFADQGIANIILAVIAITIPVYYEYMSSD